MLALNLNSAMKQFALEPSWMSKRMKALRFSMINIPGRIVEHSRELIIRLVKNNPAVNLLIEARRRIMALSSVPSG
jgi:hypothetical protein